MPAAAQTVIFAERYNADVALASKMVFVTTVLSSLTIPIFAMLLG
ncbi:MAG: AEC family transporter [Spirochaetota bacterium]